MAASSSFPVPLVSSRPAVPVAERPSGRPRRISPGAGHALEMLGHAIEYLSDEFVHEGGALDPHDPRIEAVQLLMSLNRAIYFECPEVPTLRERLRNLLRGISH